MYCKFLVLRTKVAPPFEQEDISKRWAEYISNLYSDNREDMPKFPIRREHPERGGSKVIKSITNGKAMGTDEVSTEVLRALDRGNLDSLTQFCNIIYGSGHITTAMEQSMFVTIQDKPHAQNCTDWTISPMSHVKNLMQQRIIANLDREVNIKWL